MCLCGSRVIVAFVLVSPVFKRCEGARIALANVKEASWNGNNKVHPLLYRYDGIRLRVPRKYTFYKLAAFALRAKCRRPARFCKGKNINVSFPPAVCVRYESVTTTTTTTTTTFNLSQTAKNYSAMTPDLEIFSFGMPTRS